MSRLVITGTGGGSPNRLEINDFVNNEKFFSLYIQVLRTSLYITSSQVVVDRNFISYSGYV